MAKKEFGKYYLGLDIGTDSVGWAVTDQEYNLMKFNGKQMWGVHLFDEGNPAAARRTFRTARRRSGRKKQRLALLRELFSEEIAAIDPGFYLRLQESMFTKDDKTVPQTNSLFANPDFRDRDYHREYPTIYHLRRALLEDKEPRHDVRLLYLAIAHMLKHRGHFLLPGEGFETGDAFETQFTALQDALLQQLDVNIECTDHEALSDILRTPASCSAKKEKLYKFFGIAKLPRPKTDEDMERKLSQDQKSEWLALLAGCAAKTDKLFRDEALADSEVKKIDFKSADMEDTAKLEATLGERMDCLTYAKALYDWAVLADILGGSHFLCQAKVCSYEKHKKDLQNLKAAFRKHLKGEYSAFFRDEQGDKNYIAYIGKSMAKNNRSTCSRNEFLAELKNKLKTFSEDPLVSEILTEIENDTFLPRQSSKDNGGIPYQLQLQELKAILSVQEKHFPFLSQKHADGRTVSEKLCAILSFRIPYYVGPVNDAHKRDGSGFCWVVRKEPGPVRPWNFEEKVDLDASGEAFIRRMTSTCTYLIGAEVLPKDSLLYSRFMVLN
ncbi:MAG: type II CRISPR RNA-guided endonuclease Cas9, partial [Ruminiclostridium sp.]|nr:type II CRISPR RNA-guided endonuclease Cas9 [Ruminiclostridium sp.]